VANHDLRLLTARFFPVFPNNARGLFADRQTPDIALLDGNLILLPFIVVLPPDSLCLCDFGELCYPPSEPTEPTEGPTDPPGFRI
jgi:hypothetical protein